MASTTTAHPDIVRVGIDQLVPVFQAKQTQYAEAMVKRRIKTNQEFYRALQHTGLGIAPAIGQGTGIPFSDFNTKNRADYYGVKRAIGYSATTEKWERDQYGLMVKIAMMIALSMNQAEEQAAANLQNFMLTTNGADGVPTASSAGLASGTGHIIDTGVVNNRGVRSGTAWVDVTMDALMLGRAVQELMEQKGDRGEPLPSAGPYDLWTAPAYADLGYRLSESPNQAQTNNNDKSFVYKSIRNHIVNPFFTNRNQWSLIEQGEMKVNAARIEWRPVRTKTWDDNDHDLKKAAATQIFLYTWLDWRGAWSTAGA